LDGQRILVLRFGGQNQTETIVGWRKVDFTQIRKYVYE